MVLVNKTQSKSASSDVGFRVRPQSLPSYRDQHSSSYIYTGGGVSWSHDLPSYRDQHSSSYIYTGGVSWSHDLCVTCGLITPCDISKRSHDPLQVKLLLCEFQFQKRCLLNSQILRRFPWEHRCSSRRILPRRSHTTRRPCSGTPGNRLSCRWTPSDTSR